MNVNAWTVERAAGQRWDAVVIGAGPAGTLVAHGLARRGRAVLLVEREQFPREKVCGGCLSGRSLAALATAGLGGLAERLGAVPYGRLRLVCGDRQALLGLPAGVTVSRGVLDAALVESARDAGAAWLPGVRAVTRAGTADRIVELSGSGARRVEIRAAVVVLAAGLAAGAAAPEIAVHVAKRSRIGAGAILTSPPPWLESGEIFMAVGRGGYVGLARSEAGRAIAAAALDPAFVKQAGGAGAAAAAILAQCGLSAPDAAPNWRATPPLTRQAARVAAYRLLLVGDATGYVEPFTGEGMASAMEGALESIDLCDAGIDHWDAAIEARWEAACRAAARRRRTVRGAAALLRRPGLVALATAAIASAPGLAAPLARRVQAGATA